VKRVRLRPKRVRLGLVVPVSVPGSVLALACVVSSLIARLLLALVPFDSHPIHLHVAQLALLGPHHHASTLAVQGHLPVPELPEQVERLARGLLQGRAQLVRLHPALQLVAHGAARPEEAVGRHEAIDPLVRAEVVVMGEPVLETLARLREVLRPGPVPQLLGDRLPQPFTLAERLGVVRARHHVADALARQQLVERAPAAPRVVLRPLVGQYLLGLAEARDAVQQALLHHLGLLVRA
jgi:hypothetical protein